MSVQPRPIDIGAEETGKEEEAVEDGYAEEYGIDNLIIKQRYFSLPVGHDEE